MHGNADRIGEIGSLNCGDEKDHGLHGSELVKLG